VAAERLVYRVNEAVVWATSWAAAAFWAEVGAVEGTGAMTIPFPMTVVFFTLEQIGAVVDAAGAGVVVLVADDLPDLFIPAIEPLVWADEVAPFVVGCEEASASETAPNTSTAAVATETAPVHHTLPAIPMAAHCRAVRCRKSPMPTLLVVSPLRASPRRVWSRSGRG
jgi:hypothetical protein